MWCKFCLPSVKVDISRSIFRWRQKAEVFPVQNAMATILSVSYWETTTVPWADICAFQWAYTPIKFHARWWVYLVTWLGSPHTNGIPTWTRRKMKRRRHQLTIWNMYAKERENDLNIQWISIFLHKNLFSSLMLKASVPKSRVLGSNLGLAMPKVFEMAPLPTWMVDPSWVINY